MSGAGTMLLRCEFGDELEHRAEHEEVANAMPMRNSSVLPSTSGSARRFSCAYRPGAMKAQA